ncbi:hypothetical protein M1D72_14530 [Vibrio sp. AK197]
MMAITIRDVESHEEMLAELIQLTNENTKSKSLIRGGYMALSYYSQYQAEKEKRESLERELYQLKRKISDFNRSFAALSQID